MIIEPINEYIFLSRRENSETYTYIFNLPEVVLLFDLPNYCAEIYEYITSLKKPVKALLSSGVAGIRDGVMWQQAGVEVYIHEADKNNTLLEMSPNIVFRYMPSFDYNIQIISTPGYTMGSVCLLDMTTKSLCTGNTIVTDNKGNIENFITESMSETDILLRNESYKNLLQYDFDSILPAQGKRIAHNARVTIQNYLKKTSHLS